MIHRHRLSNYTVKKIIHHFCIDIDATRCSDLLSLNRNTINRYYMLFRKAIYHDRIHQIEKFNGTIEVDECYIGAKRIRGFHGKLKRGRGTNKQPVFGIMQRYDDTGKKHVFTELVDNCKAQTLIPVIQGKVDIRSVVNADSWKSYDALVKVGYDKLFRVNHSANEFAFKGEDGATVTVNGIESFWSFAKRRMAKFNGIKENLDLHFKESEWRWSHSPPEMSQARNKRKKYLLDLEQDLWHLVSNYICSIKIEK